MNVPKKTAGQAVKVKVSGQPISVERIINKVALKLELDRPAPEGFKAIIDGVVIDPESDTYQLPGGARGFTAQFLSRVQNAAGIQQIETKHEEVIIDGEPGVAVTVACIRPRAGELPIRKEATCRMSYRDAYIRYLRNGVNDTEKEKARERSFLPRKLETMALNRCIANLAGIKRAERGDRLLTEHGPVVWAFRRDQLDMSRPEVQRAYIDAAAGSAARLFGTKPVEHLEHDEDGEALEMPPDDETISAHDPELGAVSDAEYTDDDGWEDYDATEEDDEEEAVEGGGGEGEEAEDEEEDGDPFPPHWPYPEDHEASQAVLTATTKRELWAAVKELPVSDCSTFLAKWCLETEYDLDSDEYDIAAIWNAKKGKDAQRAACRALMLHYGIEQ